MVILKPHFPHLFPLHFTFFFCRIASFIFYFRIGWKTCDSRCDSRSRGDLCDSRGRGEPGGPGDHMDQEEPKSSEVEGYINFHNFLQLQHLPHLFCPQNYIFFFFVSLEPQRGAIPCAIPEAEGSQEDQGDHRDQEEPKSSEVEGYINFHNFLQLQHLPHLFYPQNYIYFFCFIRTPKRCDSLCNSQGRGKPGGPVWQ